MSSGSARKRLGPLRLLLSLCAILLPGQAAASCGSAFCSVNTNWTTESALVGTGSVLDLRFEYLDQDHLRSGSKSISMGETHSDHDELETVNRNYLLTFSHSFKSPWGVWIVAPVVDRDHSHLHLGGDDPELETWSFTDLGDMSLLGRYRLPSYGTAEHQVTTGLNFGLKLPTGKTDVVNDDGEEAERSLQPGSGTTDAVIGAYYQQRMPVHNSIWFTQLLYQHALNSDQGYKPGARFAVDLGYSHMFGKRLGAVVQLNLLMRGRDQGSAAEPEDSGGEYLSLSPGLNCALGRLWQAYGYLQLPLYQHVNGIQLTADWSVVAGVSRRF